MVRLICNLFLVSHVIGCFWYLTITRFGDVDWHASRVVLLARKVFSERLCDPGAPPHSPAGAGLARVPRQSGPKTSKNSTGDTRRTHREVVLRHRGLRDVTLVLGLQRRPVHVHGPRPLRHAAVPLGGRCFVCFGALRFGGRGRFGSPGLVVSAEGLFLFAIFVASKQTVERLRLSSSGSSAVLVPGGPSLSVERGARVSAPNGPGRHGRRRVHCRRDHLAVPPGRAAARDPRAPLTRERPPSFVCLRFLGQRPGPFDLPGCDAAPPVFARRRAAPGSCAVPGPALSPRYHRLHQRTMKHLEELTWVKEAVRPTDGRLKQRFLNG